MGLLRTEDRGAVRHLVLDRADKRNAMNSELIAELAGAVENAAADDSVRVVVMRGEGAMFSSGMDLNDLRSLSENPGDLRRFRRPILAAWNLLEEMPKPTICQIHGAALGERSSSRWPAISARWPKTQWPGSWKCESGCCPTWVAARACPPWSGWATPRS